MKDTRFSNAFMKLDVNLDHGECTFYAGAHMDKKPMLVVTNCSTSLPGQSVERKRREFVDGVIVCSKYVCTQPEMHDMYRRHFNAIDLFNRDCFGSHSLQFAVTTKSWSRRMFLAVLGMCETNALNAYRATVGPMERYAWLNALADKLIHNPWLEEEEDVVMSQPMQFQPQAVECGLQYRLNGRAKCEVCGALSQWRCPCGFTCCRATTSESAPSTDCYFRHIRNVLTGHPLVDDDE